MGNLIGILTRVTGTDRGRNHQIIYASYCLHKFKSCMCHPLKKCLNSRRSHQNSSIEKAVLKSFAKFTGKHLVLESPVKRLAGFKTCNFLKKRLRHRCFPVKIAKFLRTLILMKICEQLLLLFLFLTVNISSCFCS